MSTKQIIICDICKREIKSGSIYIHKLIVTGKFKRTLAEETSKELEVIRTVDLCQSCATVILDSILDKKENTDDNPELATFLYLQGVPKQKEDN